MVTRAFCPICRTVPVRPPLDRCRPCILTTTANPTIEARFWGDRELFLMWRMRRDAARSIWPARLGNNHARGDETLPSSTFLPRVWLDGKQRGGCFDDGTVNADGSFIWFRRRCPIADRAHLDDLRDDARQAFRGLR